MQKTEKPKQKKQKTAPLEMSCSKPGGGRNFLNDTTPKTFDPRFSEDCGEIDRIGFIKNYAFLQSNLEAEIKHLQKNFRPGQEKQLQSLKDKYKTRAEQIKDVEARIQWHKEERERVVDGKRPYFISKSDMIKKQKERKFKELKEAGKLQKYQKKRNKKLLAKDRKDGFIESS